MRDRKSDSDVKSLWVELPILYVVTDRWMGVHLLYLGPKLRPFMLQVVFLVSGWKPHLSLASWWHVECPQFAGGGRARASKYRLPYSKGRAKKNEVIWGDHTRAQKRAIATDVIIVCCSGSGKTLLGNTLNPCSYPRSSLLFCPCCSALAFPPLLFRPCQVSTAIALDAIPPCLLKS